MSDQELRDKLASEHYPDQGPEETMLRAGYKAGWDAARTNPLAQTVNLNAQGLEATVKGTVDRLRAEVERLNLLNAELKVTVLENDEFWIKECEKLAEALEEINKQELNSQRPGGEHSTSAKISYQALAEYRKETERKPRSDYLDGRD